MMLLGVWRRGNSFAPLHDCRGSGAGTRSILSRL
jgi:hypothetical protein